MSEATVLCLADFNVSNLAAYLTDRTDPPGIQTVATEYGQVVPLLIDEGAPCWDPRPDATLVWTRPESVSRSFQRLLWHEVVTWAEIQSETDAFLDLVIRVAGRSGCVIVPTWTLPSHDRGLGPLDMCPESGPRGVLLRMNARLTERLSDQRGFYVLDANRWLAQSRRPGFNAKLWYMAKIAFDNEVLKCAASDLKATLRAVRGEYRKLVVVDLDDTLWGGVVGDVGWQNLVLGGHDSRGEALVDFQHRLRALANRGIVLGIISKNEEAVALEAIDRHPEMILRRGDFAGWRINWNDKAQNLADLVAELNLGLQSVVFIDDNPAERDRVRQALPEVLVPEWPADPLAYPAALAELSCFDVASLTQEDRQRGSLYRAARQREAARVQVTSVEEWLTSLGMVVTIEALGSSDLTRAVQLLNKTNQMNLSTRRMTEDELIGWSREVGRRVWVVRVADRFGAMGLTGLLSVEVRVDELHIVDFVLSCRVFGRKVEETMLGRAVQQAREMRLGWVVAQYLPTPKNRPCIEFLRRSGMAEGQDGVFRWDAGSKLPSPTGLSVETPSPP